MPVELGWDPGLQNPMLLTTHFPWVLKIGARKLKNEHHCIWSLSVSLLLIFLPYYRFVNVCQLLLVTNMYQKPTASCLLYHRGWEKNTHLTLLMCWCLRQKERQINWGCLKGTKRLCFFLLMRYTFPKKKKEIIFCI